MKKLSAIAIFIVALVILLTATSKVSARTIPEEKAHTSISIVTRIEPCSVIGDEDRTIIPFYSTGNRWQNQIDNSFYMSHGMLRVYGLGVEPTKECPDCIELQRGIWPLDLSGQICYILYRYCNSGEKFCEDSIYLYKSPLSDIHIWRGD